MTVATGRSVALVAALMLLMVVSGVAQELHSLGLIKETELPDWVLPSPIEVNQATELDEFIDNSAGLPPVGNQGGQGSCTAWATGYYWLSYMQWLDYGWDMTDRTHQMSPAFVYNQINRGGDNGSNISDAFMLFEELGCGRYVDMPYTDMNCTAFPPEAAFREGMTFRTQNTYDIDVTNPTGILQLKAHLAAGGMAVIGIAVYPNFDGISYHDYNYCVADVGGELRGHHAVTVVGYDDSRVTSDGVGAFRMVNSWGSWGDDGYWWMSYEAMMSTLLCHGYAMYGSDRPQYEPTLMACIEPTHEDRYSVRWEVGVGTPDNPQFTHSAFDFGGWWGAAQHAYPEDACFWMDLTDGRALLDADAANDLFICGDDTETNNGLSGYVESVRIVDTTVDPQHVATCFNMPVDIPDNGNGECDVPVVLYYPAVPPTAVSGDIDLYTGSISLNWPAIDEGADFVGYNVWRDGELLGQTTDTSYDDTVDEFGVYTYQVTSVWQPCQSWFSPVEDVNYITGLAATYPEVQQGQEIGDNVEITLSWEQVRPWEVSVDDGSSEQPLALGANCVPGALFAQQFTIAEDGLLTHVSAFVHATTGADPGYVRLGVYSAGVDDITPGALLAESDPMDPVAGEWLVADLGTSRLPVEAGDVLWLTMAFDVPGTSGIGYDTNILDSVNRAICPDGINWVSLQTNGGAGMIRATVGSQEIAGGETGLLGWHVYMDGDQVAEVMDGSHSYAGLINVMSGSHTFRVDAVYQQGVWTGEDVVWMYTGVGEAAPAQPKQFSVSQATPNPFNSMTSVQVTMPVAGELTVAVYNMLGQRVAELASGKYAAGSHRIMFDGSAHASGVYLLRVSAQGNQDEIRKVVYLR